MTLEQHLKRIEETLTFHLLFPTAGPVNKDRAALVSLRAIAEHCNVEMEPLPDEVSNAERMREAARTYNERKRQRS
jgi:hypothetical protein